MKQLSHARSLVFVVLMMAAQVASAVALGDINTQTRLGDRLQAHIPVKLGNADYTVDELQASLLNDTQAAKYGVELLSARYQFQLAITEHQGQLVVKVSSRKPITEPFINMMVQLAWPGGSLAREYTVMLDY